MNDLYYIERDHSVKSVSYTRDRAMSVSPIFHQDRKKALNEAKRRLTEKVMELARQLIEIEKELNGNPRREG